MSTALILFCALCLDAIFGEPDWLWSRVPHPAVLMGKVVGRLDKKLNTGRHQQAKGIVTLAILLCLGGAIGWLLSLLGPIVEVLVAAVLLAQRSLVEHVEAVADGLRINLEEGRKMVARIVSRDTQHMDESQTARAAIESAAENLSDGIVAPALLFLVGGLPGLICYKFVNTADSMIGYRNPRYEAFGWASARFDGLMNLIPARLTGAVLAIVAQKTGDWPDIAADARRHRSPNAGWPEAAMARAIDVALAGPRSYDGMMRDLAWVNEAGRQVIGPRDVDKAVRKLWQVWRTLIIATAVLALLLVLI